MVALADLLEQTIRSCWVKGARVLAAGPDIDVEPRLALALHLVLHELATNANKYGALSSAAGCVQVHWTIRHVAGAVPKLAIVWTEHGGPEVKQPRHRGFGSRLIKKALQGYGAVRVKFKPAGLVCVMLVDLSAKRGRAPFSSVHYEADSTINHNDEWSGQAPAGESA
jgi:two-component sensor histidine kinase